MFFDVGVEAAEAALVIGEEPFGNARDNGCENEEQRKNDGSPERQSCRKQRHGDEGADDVDNGFDNGGEIVREGGVDLVDVVGHAAHEISCRVGVEIGHRQIGHLAEEGAAQIICQPLADNGHGVDLDQRDNRDGGKKNDQQQCIWPENACRRICEDEVAGGADALHGKEHDRRDRCAH